MIIIIIVVVDDDALIRELVALEFQDAGFDVVEAQDASADLPYIPIGLSRKGGST